MEGLLSQNVGRSTGGSQESNHLREKGLHVLIHESDPEDQVTFTLTDPPHEAPGGAHHVVKVLWTILDRHRRHPSLSTNLLPAKRGGCSSHVREHRMVIFTQLRYTNSTPDFLPSLSVRMSGGRNTGPRQYSPLL